MDIADWKGVPFRRALASAERFNDCAIRRALEKVKTRGSRSSALLLRVTLPDHLRLPVPGRCFDSTRDFITN